MGSSRYRRHGVRGARDGTRSEGSHRRGRARDDRFPRVAVALVLIAAALAGGCDGGKSRVNRATVLPPKEEESFTAIDSPSLQYLPRQQEAPGWKLERDPMVVPANRLLGYLGDDARHFLPYQVLDLTLGKYSGANNNGFATVEIFRFPDSLRAFGAYSVRKIGPIRFLNLANEAFEAKHTIHLWRGQFYLRVAGGGSPDGNESLKKLIAFVSDKMPAAPGQPDAFNLFPTANRIAHSERYSVESGLQQSFLAHSFQVTFDLGGSPVEAIIVPSANPGAASQILNDYRNLYAHNGRLLDPVPNLGEDNFTAEDRYLGRAVAFRIDRFVVAFNGYKDRQGLVDLASAMDKGMVEAFGKKATTEER
jgi:hypothetical protein